MNPIFELKTISPECVRNRLIYSPETGRFQRCDRKNGRPSSRTTVGTKSKHDGYVTICVSGTCYMAHRLAWLYVYGKLPETMLDHINGDRSDNRISNLRLSSFTENQENKRKAQKNNSTGFLGVVPYRGKFRAQIQTKKRVRCLGVFEHPQEAHLCYLENKRALHRGCTI